MWKITKDHISGADEDTRVGWSGDKMGGDIYGIEPVAELPNEGLELVAFKLFDDDGELYYEGELHDDDECLNQIEALRFGTSDAGCTTITVRRPGGFVQEIA